jgi:hypothetical protein
VFVSTHQRLRVGEALQGRVTPLDSITVIQHNSEPTGSIFCLMDFFHCVRNVRVLDQQLGGGSQVVTIACILDALATIEKPPRKVIPQVIIFFVVDLAFNLTRHNPVVS